MTFGITDDIKDRVTATRIFRLLHRIADEIRSKVGVARDLAIQRAIEVIESDLVQDAIAKIPASWRQAFVKLVERLRARANDAGKKM